MANMNLIGLFVTKLWPVQALACGGGGDGGDGGATKNIISPKFTNFGDIITTNVSYIGHNVKTSELDDFAFFRTQSYISKICCFNFLPSLLFGWQNHFSHQFRAIYYLTFSPTLDFFSKDPLFAPIHMKSLPKVKFGQVGVGSNIAQNHSSSDIWSYLVLFTPIPKKSLPKVKLGQV